jgi:hypothetical protein
MKILRAARKVAGWNRRFLSGFVHRVMGVAEARHTMTGNAINDGDSEGAEIY